MRPLRLISVLLLSTVAAASLAQEPRDRRRSVEGAERTPWREQELVLPALPSDESLIVMQSDFFDDRYRYLLDADSLTVGEEDRVVRYTVVIEPTDGQRHVLYEGLRCEPPRARIYGIAAGRQFRPRHGEEWGGIPESGPFVYRRALADGIACDTAGQPRAAADIVRRLGGARPRGPRFERVPAFYD